MTPRTVKTSTGRRSSQRSWASVGCAAAGATPSIDSIICRPAYLAGGPLAEPLAVWQAQRRADLVAEPGQGHLRFQKVALNVGGRVPPEIVLGHGVAQDPDRNRTGDRIAGPGLDQLPAIDVRQLEVDEDQRRYPVTDEGIRLRTGSGMLERDSIAAKLQHIQRRDVRIVFDQEDSPLPRHIATLRELACGMHCASLGRGQLAAA